MTPAVPAPQVASSRVYVCVPNGTRRLAISEVQDVCWRLRYAHDDAHELTAASILDEYLDLLHSSPARREGIVRALRRAEAKFKRRQVASDRAVGGRAPA